MTKRKEYFKEEDLVFVEKPVRKNFKDLDKKIYGRLSVIGYAGKNKNGDSSWYCKCECGRVTRVVGTLLINSNTKSCGCQRRITITKTNELYIQQANKVHNNLYSYDSLEYTGIYNKIIVTCRKHGDFTVKAADHLNSNTGCKQCTKEKVTKSTDTFTLEAKQVHGDKYDYSSVEYKHSSLKVKIICSSHGVFMQTPHSHLAGNKCPKCSREEQKGVYNSTILNRYKDHYLKSKGCLYLIKLPDISDDVYKIGISINFTRRKNALRYDFGTVVKILEHNTNIYNAYHLEQYLHNEFSEYRYFLNDIKSGYTELFKIDSDLLEEIIMKIKNWSEVT